MPNHIDRRLADLEIELPQASTPGANYVPFARSGNLVFMTGQLSQWNGERRFIGKLGREWRLEDGQQADRKSTRLNSSHIQKSRMPSSA